MGNEQINISYLEMIADGDLEFIIHMLDLIYVSLPKDVNDILNFEIQKDYNQVGSTAHRLNNSVLMLSETEVSELVTKIEFIGKSGEGIEQLNSLVQNLSKESEIILSKIENTKRVLVSKAG